MQVRCRLANKPVLLKNIRWGNQRHNDTQHNDIQHNDIEHNDTQHNDIQHNDIEHNGTQHNYSIYIVLNDTKCILLNVANKPIMLIVMLNVVAPNQLPGGTMGPRYVLQLLFSEKLQNCKKIQQPLKQEKVQI
jgi:hypothetical protein